MSHLECRQQVQQARQRLTGQLHSTRQQAGSLQDALQQSLSPARIVTTGLLGGLLTGLLGPERLPRAALRHAGALGSLPRLLAGLLPLWQQLQSVSGTQPAGTLKEAGNPPE